MIEAEHKLCLSYETFSHIVAIVRVVGGSGDSKCVRVYGQGKDAFLCRVSGKGKETAEGEGLETESRIGG